MTEVRTFSAIHIPTPVEAVLRRLGYRRRHTSMNEAQRRLLESAMDEAASLLELKGAARILEITDHGEEVTRLEGGVEFESASLARLLAPASAVLLMAATAGSEIMAAIGADVAGADVTRGVIIDATASETTDAALDWIMNLYTRELARQNLTLTSMRYSAGYGDFDLMNQHTFYELLHLDDLGVRITPSAQLMPEKSVTALCGIIPAKRETA